MRIFKNVLALAGVTTVILGATSAFAHHSFNMFDNKKSATIEGTIKEFHWANPHCWVQVMVKDPATDQEVEWSIETTSPGGLTRHGWKKTSIKAGDKAVVTIHPMKDGSASGALLTIKLNGETLLEDPENTKF